MDHLCRFSAKSFYSFSKRRVHKIDERTNGEVENIIARTNLNCRSRGGINTAHLCTQLILRQSLASADRLYCLRWSGAVSLRQKAELSVIAADRLTLSLTLNVTYFSTWNSLPMCVVSVHTINCFKSKLEKHLTIVLILFNKCSV